MRRHAIMAGCAAVVAGAAAFGGWPTRAGTPALPEQAGVTLADCAFLAGAWKGAMGDDRVEEHWTAPDGTNILGMFRWMDAGGAPNVCEILTISEEADGVILRLRHFDGTLTGWASETAPMTLRLAEASAGKAVFRAVESEKKLSAVTYHCETPDRLRVLVEFPAGAQEPLDFRLTRAAPGAK